MHISYPALITATALTMLSACATNTDPQPSAAATSVQVQTAPAPVASSPAPFKDGTVAEFSKTETRLDKADIANITKNIEAFKKAKAIEITGYCDRKDNMLNAQQVALARASAVQTELIKQGVAGNKMHLKYITAEARHSVAVLLK